MFIIVKPALVKLSAFALGIVLEFLFARLSSGQKDWNVKPARTPKIYSNIYYSFIYLA